ncbi:MAG TPA: hypothetical protein VGM77_05910 [Gemmatimonadales bacterium]|jgi:hypothetical protein
MTRIVPLLAALTIVATASLRAQASDTIGPTTPGKTLGIDGYQRNWPVLRRQCAAERTGTELDRSDKALKIEGTVRHQYSDSLQHLLACLRVLNYVDGDESVITFLGAGGKALAAWLTLAAHRAPDPKADEMVALLALDLPNGPTFGAGSVRSAVAQAAGQRQRVAEAMYRAVRAGAPSPAVLRACVLYALAVGDAATARYCADQALTRGVDSTWHLVQLSWLAARHADTAAAVSLFRAAMATAHDPASEAEITRRLRRGGDQGAPAFAAALLRDEARTDFVSPLLEYCPVWAEVNGARAQASGNCVGAHGRTEAALGVIGNLARLWDPATGEPIGIFTVAVADDDDAPASSVPKDVTMSLRQWDWSAALWRDSTVRPQLGTTGTKDHRELVAALLAEPVMAAGAWSIVVSYQGNVGRVSAEGGPPLSRDPFALSDVIVGAKSQRLATQVGQDTITLTPLNTLAPAEPVTLFYQVRSPSRQNALRSVVTFRRITAGRVAPEPVLTLAAPVSVAAGLTGVERGLDLSRFGRGDYQVEVRMIASDGTALASRTTNLLVR